MDGSGWVAFASIAFTGVLGLLTLIVKGQQDDKLKDLKEQNKEQAKQIEAQAKQIKTLEGEQVKCEAESRKCAEDRATDRAALATATKALAKRDEEDKAELQRQIDELRAGKKDETAEHEPLP